MTTNANPQTDRPRVVIIGAGFAGITAAKRLRRVPVDITLIDKRNHHLFQPLLYQVATAGLNPSDIAWPIRNIFARQRNVRVVLGDVQAVDRQARAVVTGSARYRYDRLIVATGSRHSYFGQDAWEPYAPGLKRIIDAVEIRKRVLLAFERAETAVDPEERRRQLTFLVVGGGPTGVEMAGSIAELASHALARDFRAIDAASARIVLAEAGDRLLRAFPTSLSDYAQRALESLGVEVVLGERVSIDGTRGATLGSEPLPCATMIWAAGVHIPRVAKWFGVEASRSGQVPVGPDLTLADDPNVFIAGDAAKVPWDGGEVPGIAPAAKQMGRYAAEVIAARAAGGPAPAPFRYSHAGNLATIGRHSAVVDFGRVKLKGGLAWWLWGVAHIYFLIGVRAPMLVALQWFWSYLTYGKGARLITGAVPMFGSAHDPEAEATPAPPASATPAPSISKAALSKVER
ncbi:MAG: NAD(P)/FAD-dependent oxidoreductase [Pseudomonadota bacterium]